MNVRQYRETSEAIAATLPEVNELLPGATPTGAYCLGALCALAWQDRVKPSRTLLEMAVKCPSIEQAGELYWEYRLFRDSCEPGSRRNAG